MKNYISKSKYTVFSLSAIFLSASLILGYIEALFPFNFGILGIKIGLSNIITILGLLFLGTKRTFVINLLRLVILGILFSNLIRFFISVAGFLLSFLIMVVAIKALKFDIIISSIFGGVSHNIGQIIAVSFISKNIEIYKLLYVYIILGIVSGLIVGIISSLIYKSLRKILIE